MRRVSAAAWLGLLLALACPLVLAARGSAGTSAPGQRIAVEERFAKGSSPGTFKLIPLTAGRIRADSGTVTGSITPRPTKTVAGQRVTTYTGRETLTGKRGTFRIDATVSSSNAGGNYIAGSGTWSVAAPGTKAYATFRASGRASGVVTPRKVIYTRYEGYVSSP